MTGRMTIVTLKQFRFEIGLAVMLALLATAIGLMIHLRVDALAVTQECSTKCGASEDAAISTQVASAWRVRVSNHRQYLPERRRRPAVLDHGLLPFVLGSFGASRLSLANWRIRTAQSAWG